MPCGQVSILSRAKDISGITLSKTTGATQMLRLDKPESKATFVGPLRLLLSHVKPTAMKSLKSTAGRSVDIEKWRQEILIPAQHEYTIDYKDYVGYAADGCLVVTAGDDDIPTQTQTGQDLPCDFAVTSLKPNQYIFPPSCEPCESSVVKAPPTCATPIPIAVAAGGCIRPRFFNGMFITREDMETQLRYIRVKQRLQNRAMGQGVVWGFPLFLDGTRIRVGAGYGVDCCGNDLTVTCDYSVNIESLLSDPVLCGNLDDCAALVLEYVECPENPRPVHGESCGQAKPACEMSRVRETVRLRLKPKCNETKHTDPLAKAFENFLKLIRVPTQTAPTNPQAPAPDWQVSTGENIPWKMSVTGHNPGNPAQDPVVEIPAGSADQPKWVPIRRVGDSVTVEISATDGSMFSKLELTDEGGNAPGALRSQDESGASFEEKMTMQPNPLHLFHMDWAIESPAMRSPSDEPAEIRLTVMPEKDFAFENSEWVSAVEPSRIKLTMPLPPSGVQLQVGQYLHLNFVGGINSFWKIVTIEIVQGKMVVQVDLDDSVANPAFPFPEGPPQVTAVLRITHVQVELATAVEVPAAAPAPSCCADPCCGDLDSMTPQDRLLLLVMALYYGRILQEIAELKARGKENQSSTAFVELLLIERTLLRALTRFRPAEGSFSDFDDAARDLYRLWCGRAIYSGPDCGCDCGCSGENSGIVIGCAYFTAGQICRLSPFDGRRWVLHPPLLQHWASAFGYPALDEAMMRLFSRLCCIGALPALPDKFRAAADLIGSKLRSTAAYSGVAYSTTGFTTNSPMAAVSAVPDFARLSPDLECWRSLMTSVLRMLLSIETVSAAALVDNVNRFLCHPQCGLGKPDPEKWSRHDVIVRTMVTRASHAAEIHPVMRGASNDLTVSIAARAPITAVPAAAKILKPLQKAGVTTVADLLALPPEEAVRLVGSKYAPVLNKAYPQAEALPGDVGAAVAKAIANIDKEGDTSPEDWSEKERLAALKKGLAESLKGVVDNKSLSDALDEWSAGIKARAKA